MNVTLSAATAEDRAVAAIREHHAALLRGLHIRLGDLRAAISSGDRYVGVLGTLTSYLATEVLPHAAAEEATLYPAAAADPAGALFVEAMLLDHEELTARTRALASVCGPFAALALAEGVAIVFELHVRKENDLLLPALRAAEDVDLAALLEGMRERLADRV